MSLRVFAIPVAYLALTVALAFSSAVFASANPILAIVLMVAAVAAGTCTVKIFRVIFEVYFTELLHKPEPKPEPSSCHSKIPKLSLSKPKLKLKPAEKPSPKPVFIEEEEQEEEKEKHVEQAKEVIIEVKTREKSGGFKATLKAVAYEIFDTIYALVEDILS